MAHMTGSEDLSANTHRQLWDQLDSYRFTCWEDWAPQTTQAATGLIDPLLARGEFSDLKHPDPLGWLSAEENVTFASLFSGVTFALHFTLTGHSS